MERIKKNIPNCVTLLRIIGSLALLGLDTSDRVFWYIYIFCGFTDVLDGFLARLLNVTSEVGSKLDSISDISFYLVMLFKFFNDFRNNIPSWAWYWLVIIIILRFISYSVSFIKTKELQHSHSIFNKMTGMLAFVLPFVYNSRIVNYYCVFALLIGALGMIEDLKESFRVPKKGG